MTVRDPESWYESMSSTIYLLRKITGGSLPIKAALRLAQLFAPGPVGTARLADRLVWEDTFDRCFEDKEYAMHVFDRTNEAVRRRVPPERLLVFDVREGWDPLCDFLGVEVPERTFPHLNETKEMRRRLLAIAALSIAVPVLTTLLVLTAGLFVTTRLIRSLKRSCPQEL